MKSNAISSPSRTIESSKRTAAIATDASLINSNLPKLEREMRNLKLHEKISFIKTDEFETKSFTIAEGGYGKIFPATYMSTKIVAKRIRQTRDGNKFIIREIITLLECKHPNFVRIMAVSVEFDYYCWILMEKVNGQTLRYVLFDPHTRNSYNLTPQDRNYIAHQICEAVAFMHGHHKSISHKDLKAENIMVEKSNRHVTIVDLGLSKLDNMDEYLKTTAADGFQGTSYYMCPAQVLHGISLGAPADLWCLGCLLYEIYTENFSWDDKVDPAYEVYEQLQSLYQKGETPEITDEIPVEIRKLVKALLNLDPEKRPPASELVKVFEEMKERARHVSEE